MFIWPARPKVVWWQLLLKISKVTIFFLWNEYVCTCQHLLIKSNTFKLCWRSLHQCDSGIFNIYTLIALSGRLVGRVDLWLIYAVLKLLMHKRA